MLGTTCPDSGNHLKSIGTAGPSLVVASASFTLLVDIAHVSLETAYFWKSISSEKRIVLESG
jgi:hypothetical protein